MSLTLHNPNRKVPVGASKFKTLKYQYKDQTTGEIVRQFSSPKKVHSNVFEMRELPTSTPELNNLVMQVDDLKSKLQSYDNSFDKLANRLNRVESKLRRKQVRDAKIYIESAKNARTVETLVLQLKNLIAERDHLSKDNIIERLKHVITEAVSTSLKHLKSKRDVTGSVDSPTPSSISKPVMSKSSYSSDQLRVPPEPNAGFELAAAKLKLESIQQSDNQRTRSLRFEEDLKQPPAIEIKLKVKKSLKAKDTIDEGNQLEMEEFSQEKKMVPIPFPEPKSKASVMKKQFSLLGVLFPFKNLAQDFFKKSNKDQKTDNSTKPSIAPDPEPDPWKKAAISNNQTPMEPLKKKPLKIFQTKKT